MGSKAVRCPECQKIFNYFESEFRPFCSDLCQKVDLNMWFDEEYKVPSQHIHEPMDDLNE